MIDRIYFLLLFPLACFVLAGCRSNLPDGLPRLYSCSISVTQDAKPLAGATVIFYPKTRAGGPSWTPMGVTDASGVAVMRVNALYDGAPLGSYRVVISKTEEQQANSSPAPPEGTPAYDRWLEGGGDALKEFSLVERIYTDPEKTPHDHERRQYQDAGRGKGNTISFVGDTAPVTHVPGSVASKYTTSGSSSWPCMSISTRSFSTRNSFKSLPSRSVAAASFGERNECRAK